MTFYFSLIMVTVTSYFVDRQRVTAKRYFSKVIFSKVIFSNLALYFSTACQRLIRDYRTAENLRLKCAAVRELRAFLKGMSVEAKKNHSAQCSNCIATTALSVIRDRNSSRRVLFHDFTNRLIRQRQVVLNASLFNMEAN